MYLKWPSHYNVKNSIEIFFIKTDVSEFSFLQAEKFYKIKNNSHVGSWR